MFLLELGRVNCRTPLNPIQTKKIINFNPKSEMV